MLILLLIQQAISYASLASFYPQYCDFDSSKTYVLTKEGFPVSISRFGYEQMTADALKYTEGHEIKPESIIHNIVIVAEGQPFHLNRMAVFGIAECFSDQNSTNDFESCLKEAALTYGSRLTLSSPLTLLNGHSENLCGAKINTNGLRTVSKTNIEALNHCFDAKVEYGDEEVDTDTKAKKVTKENVNTSTFQTVKSSLSSALSSKTGKDYVAKMNTKRAIQCLLDAELAPKINALVEHLSPKIKTRLFFDPRVADIVNLDIDNEMFNELNKNKLDHMECMLAELEKAPKA